MILVYYLINTTKQRYNGGEKVKFDNNLPIYLQIINLIKRKIASGEMKGGDKLPSVREFSKELKVNPNTIQRAYQELEREEVIFTKRGMGSFVTEDQEKIINLKKNIATNVVKKFMEEMKEIGFKKEEILEIIKEEKAEEE